MKKAPVYRKMIFPALLALCSWSACSTIRAPRVSRHATVEPWNETMAEDDIPILNGGPALSVHERFMSARIR